MTDDWNIKVDVVSDRVAGHQVVTSRTALPDNVRVSRIKSSPVSAEEFVVELRLRRLPDGDPRIADVPTSLLGNFAVGPGDDVDDYAARVRRRQAEEQQ